MPPPALSLTQVIQLVVYLHAVSVVLPALEYLSLRREFSAKGFYSWKIFQLAGRSWRGGNQKNRLGDTLFGERGTLVLVAIRICVGVLIVLFPVLTWRQWICLGVSAVLLCLFSWRQQYGEDGADQMTLIVGITCFLCFGPSQSEVSRLTGIAFIALQVTLSYFTAGVAKVISPIWRSGAALKLILSTATYGSSRAGRFLVRHGQISRVMTWGVVLFEVAFPLALFLPWPSVVWALVIGGAFHLGTAVVMGLNNFVWAFISTYPAVVFISIGLDRVLYS